MSDSELALAFGNVFPNHIKLEIDLVAHLKLMEIGVLVGILDNGYARSPFAI
jgi:hypothetical protein